MSKVLAGSRKQEVDSGIHPNRQQPVTSFDFAVMNDRTVTLEIKTIGDCLRACHVILQQGKDGCERAPLYSQLFELAANAALVLVQGYVQVMALPAATQMSQQAARQGGHRACEVSEVPSQTWPFS